MNTEIRLFNYTFYLKEILFIFFCIFMAEGIFTWLLVPTSAVGSAYQKLFSIGVTFFMIMSYRNLKTDEKIITGLFVLLTIKLLFESLIFYGSVFKQFAVFSVIYPAIFAVFIKYMLRKFDLDLLEFVARFYLFTYIAFMAIYGWQFSFSLDMIDMEDYGPFSGDSRIIHARSIFMMIIPFLWYLSRYLATRKLSALAWFSFCFIVIFIHQHRSVWSSAIFAILLFLPMYMRSNRNSATTLGRMLLVVLPLLGLAYFYLSNLAPEFTDFFAERFSEILQPDKEGSTGNFRIEQSEIYLNYVSQKPFLGWSFEGFYLSNPLVDWWEEGTGHHFHEGYIEVMFYHGIFGLLLKYGFVVFIIIKALTRKLSLQAMILVSFCLSGLLFSFNYVPPLMYWACLGMCLYYLENSSTSNA